MTSSAKATTTLPQTTLSSTSNPLVISMVSIGQSMDKCGCKRRRAVRKRLSPQPPLLLLLKSSCVFATKVERWALMNAHVSRLTINLPLSR